MVVDLSRIINRTSGDIVAYVTGSQSVAKTFFYAFSGCPDFASSGESDCGLEMVGYLDTETNEFTPYINVIKLI